MNSDFGPWGRAKTMFKPHLMQTRADGKWHCIWETTNTGKALAYVTSPDLQKWEAQSYFSPEERSKYEPKDVYPTTQKKVLVNGSEEEGWVQEVPYTTVQQIIRYAEHKKYRQSLNAERTEQDPVRFANLKPVEATIQVNAGQAKEISKHLIGIFLRISTMERTAACMPNWFRTATLSIPRRIVVTIRTGILLTPGVFRAVMLH